ncbi:MAG: hypothetical protein ACE5I8_08385 [Thermodesulfobacteriota bacterium]
MKCCKCAGKFVHERFGDGVRTFFDLWCVNCGEIIDPVILHHRIERKETTKKKIKPILPRLRSVIKSD